MIKKWMQLAENMKQFSERPNVSKTVVENFLKSICAGDIPATIERLVTDAKKHRWNNETIEAILDGILTFNGLKIGDIIDTGNLQ